MSFYIYVLVARPVEPGQLVTAADLAPVIDTTAEVVSECVVPAHLALPACVKCGRPSGLLDETDTCCECGGAA